jgi:glycine dehydrogenase subunit 2
MTAAGRTSPHVAPLSFERSRPGRCAATLPALDVPRANLPRRLVREDLPLPEVGELDIVRHYTHLSQLNYSVDTGFYPLGSCTMKYNPRINEEVARLGGFAHLHPYQDEETVQGALYLIYSLQQYLAEIGGFAAVSLQPAAGAQGEMSGVLMMRAYHLDRGDTERDVILVPDSAHGTNPATTTMSGLRVVEISSDARGNVDQDGLKTACAEHGQSLAGLMLTNPNTLGLFDENLEKTVALVHEEGGLVYGDWASPGRATWASTSSTTICTRRSALLTAAGVRDQVRSAPAQTWPISCPARSWASTPSERTSRATSTPSSGRPSRSGRSRPSTVISP